MDTSPLAISSSPRGPRCPRPYRRRDHSAQSNRRQHRPAAYSQEVASRYEANNFEKQVILPDRVMAMCRDLFEQMIANVIHRGADGTPLGPRKKTIIFCASDRHADLVAAEMNNLFSAVVYGQ